MYVQNKILLNQAIIVNKKIETILKYIALN